jgi:hypothetical protein
MALRYRKKRAAGPLCAGAAPAAPMVAVGGMRRLVTGVWVRRDRPVSLLCRATSTNLTNRTRPLSDLSLGASPSLNFVAQRKKADHLFTLFSLETVRI